MIRAHLDTRHFTFEAYGATEDEAFAILKTAWENTHRRQYPDALAFDDAVEPGDVCFYRAELGKAYRDTEELK